MLIPHRPYPDEAWDDEADGDVEHHAGEDDDGDEVEPFSPVFLLIGVVDLDDGR